jgi:Zn-dependent M16 (insulinase) family peptidase
MLELANNKDQTEKDRLSAINASLSANQKQAIVDSAAALKQRQEMEEDLDILPKVDLDDIPQDIHFSEPNHRQKQPLPLTSYAAGTNGLVYQQLIMPMPELSPAANGSFTSV